MILLLMVSSVSCKRIPPLHLHRDNHIAFNFPRIELQLKLYWDYTLGYDWEKEWYYGWDTTDVRRWGIIGYAEPTAFHLRRYYLYEDTTRLHTEVIRDEFEGTFFESTYQYGYYDLLAWNQLHLGPDNVQSIHFDENTSLDSVTAFTNASMRVSKTILRAQQYSPYAYWQPEDLYSAVYDNLHVTNDPADYDYYDEEADVWVKHIEMNLLPRTYIYLVQVILHNNNGQISTDGEADLTGMARTCNLNTGVSGKDIISVYFQTRLKPHMDKEGEDVDIIGGKLTTFGMCDLDPNKLLPYSDQPQPYPVSRAANGELMVEEANDARHYIDIRFFFDQLATDSVYSFDVTDQVRRRYKGGVLTVELDVDTLTKPTRQGGSLFDAQVVEIEDGGTYVFEFQN